VTVTVPDGGTMARDTSQCCKSVGAQSRMQQSHPSNQSCSWKISPRTERMKRTGRVTQCSIVRLLQSGMTDSSKDRDHVHLHANHTETVAVYRGIGTRLKLKRRAVESDKKIIALDPRLRKEQYGWSKMLVKNCKKLKQGIRLALSRKSP
jgi:hypothetical protein